MATISKGVTFAPGDTVTATKLNDLVDDATIKFVADDDTDNSTLEASGDKLRVKDAGITAAKLATDAVETAKIKDANVTAPKVAAGFVVQVVEATPITTATAIGSPNSITVGTGAMDNTKGAQLWSQAITLAHDTNKVEVDVLVNLAAVNNINGSRPVIGIFRTGVTNALAVGMVTLGNAATGQVRVRVIDAPGATSATYTVRAAYDASFVGFTVSGSFASGNLLGSAYASTMTLREIRA